MFLVRTVFHPKILIPLSRTVFHTWWMVTAGRPVGIFGHRNPDQWTHKYHQKSDLWVRTGHKHTIHWTLGSIVDWTMSHGGPSQCVQGHRHWVLFRFQKSPTGFMDFIHLHFSLTYVSSYMRLYCIFLVSFVCRRLIFIQSTYVASIFGWNWDAAKGNLGSIFKWRSLFMVKTLKILNIAAFSKMDFMHSLSRERWDIEVYGLDRQQSSPHFLSLVQFRQQSILI